MRMMGLSGCSSKAFRRALRIFSGGFVGSGIQEFGAQGPKNALIRLVAMGPFSQPCHLAAVLLCAIPATKHHTECMCLPRNRKEKLPAFYVRFSVSVWLRKPTERAHASERREKSLISLRFEGAKARDEEAHCAENYPTGL